VSTTGRSAERARSPEAAAWVTTAGLGSAALSNPVAAGQEAVEGWLAEHTVDLVHWRRHIHANPELSRTEFATTEFVSSWMIKAGLSPQPLPGGTGLICDIGPDGPRIGLRADMDALPLQEFTGLSFASTVPGVSHTCGHDAHTAILLGTALALADADLPQGVRLVFQPAEEVMPGGAIDVVATGAMEGVERIFALHCDPRLEVGRVGVRVGAITSAADTIELVLDSPGGHTSRPHLTSDLVYAIGTVITGLPGLLSRRIDPRTSTVMVWGAVSAGKAPNAIPQTGMLTGTVRTGDHATWSLLEPMVREIVDGLLAPTGVRYQLNYKRGVPPVVNDEQSTRIFEDAIRRIGPDALADTMQSGGGEDFSWYLEEVPGAMARLGVWSGHGEQLDLHQPTFDIDERALAVGVRVLSNIVLQAG
jgi:amidohydrolase